MSTIERTSNRTASNHPRSKGRTARQLSRPSW
jgi:hypothetical protein